MGDQGGHAHRSSGSKSPAHSPGDDESHAVGSLPAQQALAFLTGRGNLTDAALVGLWQALIAPELVHEVLSAGHAGAKLAARVDPRGKTIRDLVRDPAFDWGPKPQAQAAPAAAPAPATIGPERGREEDGLAGQLVAGGSTASQEHRPEEEASATSKEGGKSVGEGLEKSLDGVAGEGLEGDAISKGAAAIARMPRVIHLVKQKRYKEAVIYITEVLGYKEYVEVFKLLAEHMSIPLEEIAEALPRVAKVGRALEIGAEAADILLLGYEFQKGALEALAKAKEDGARDNAIYLYSSAWAHAFLWGAGSYKNPGAISEKQKQVVADGNREGAATAGNLGEKAATIGKKMLQEYGRPENAERALVDVLLKRAGIEGLRFHQAKNGPKPER